MSGCLIGVGVCLGLHQDFGFVEEEILLLDAVFFSGRTEAVFDQQPELLEQCQLGGFQGAGLFLQACDGCLLGRHCGLLGCHHGLLRLHHSLLRPKLLLQIGNKIR